MAILFLIILIMINGFLSMTEIAIISAKKSKLKTLSEEGNKDAKNALIMAENPNKFFSTVQVGITLVGILTGAFSGITLSEPIAKSLIGLGINQSLADSIAVFIVVILITYLSLIIGELLPKRLGLAYSEKIAMFIASPMSFISKIFHPFVVILTKSTDFIANILKIRSKNKLTVSEEEVRMLIQEGTKVGIFEKIEKNIVEKVLNIGDEKVTALMQARNKVVWLNTKDTDKENMNKVLKNQYSYFPVADGEIDNIVGILRTDSLLAETIENKGKKMHMKKLLHKPLLIPESKKVLDALELFKKMRIHLGIIIDEYGSVEGVITLTDILEAIVGDISDVNEQEDQTIVKRGKNSWFVDGLVSTAEFKEFFKVANLKGKDESDEFNTIGGFLMGQLERIPKTGDKIVIDGFSLEIADMDGNRVDKIIVDRNK